MRRSLMQGFLVSDYEDRFDEARADLLRWAEEGRLHQQYDVARGPRAGPLTLNRLFSGGNLGKQLLKL